MVRKCGRGLARIQSTCFAKFKKKKSKTILARHALFPEQMSIIAYTVVIDGPFIFLVVVVVVVAGDTKFYTASLLAAAERWNPKSSKIMPPVERVTCRVGLKFCVRLRAMSEGWSGGGGDGGGCMALTDAELIIKVKIKPSVWTAMTEAIKNWTGNVEYFHYNRLLFIYLHNLLFVWEQ